MRLRRPPGLLVLIFVLMVACGALRCVWERDTDFRGLDRHRTTCKHYQKESKLAAEKRRDRARESASQNLRSQLTRGGSNITYVGHYSSYTLVGPYEFIRVPSLARTEPIYEVFETYRQLWIYTSPPA
jgi:hypothetical protein